MFGFTYRDEEGGFLVIFQDHASGVVAELPAGVDGGSDVFDIVGLEVGSELPKTADFEERFSRRAGALDRSLLEEVPDGILFHRFAGPEAEGGPLVIALFTHENKALAGL